MKSGLVNPFKGTSPKYLSFFMTVLLLALVFIMSMVITLHSQNFQNETNLLIQKFSEKANNHEQTSIISGEWKKCVNYDLNIEFDCPASWTTPDSSSYDFPNYIYKTSYSNSLDLLLKYYYGPNQESNIPLTYQEYITNLSSSGYTLKDLKIAGVSAVSYSNNNQTIAFPYPTKDNKGNLILEIIYKSKPDNSDTFEKIINTFSFVDLMDLEIWKTYKDTHLGLEFKYRPDLAINKSSSGDSITLSNNSASYDLIDYDTFFYTGIALVNLNGLTPKEYALTEMCGSETQVAFWAPVRKSCLDGIQNTFEEYTNNEIRGNKFYYNPYENTVYTVIFPNKDKSKYVMLTSSTETGGGGPTEMGLKTIDQILSTFIFISNTTKWEIYTNHYLGYSVNYPDGWEVHSIYPKDEYDNGEKVNMSQTPYIFLMSKEMDSFVNIEEQQYAYKQTTFEENAEFWKNYYLGSTSGFADARKQVNKENYKIDGRDVIKNTITYQFEDMKSPGIAVWTYISLPGNHLLSVKYTSETSDEEKLNLYNQILSTFKFTN